MSYATIDDLRKWIDERVLIQLTDDLDTGSVDTVKVDEALEYASNEIDVYLGRRYKLPLSPEPAILKDKCVDIAGYRLHLRRQHGIPESWQKRYESAMSFLNGVSSGKIKLGPDDPEGTGSKGTLQVSGPEPEFSSDKLDTY